jgi:hypothetical protein
MTLLAIIALQLLGGIAFASVCLEPCPDDSEDTSCSPVCAICATCTHAQAAIVQNSTVVAPFLSSRALTGHQPVAASWPLGDDIFHVPLRG